MAFSYDLDSDRGKVRLLAIDSNNEEHIFSDEEIDTFLGMESSSVRRAAALALETIARNEAYCLKRITSLDLTTDGPATAKALLDAAKHLRDQDKEAEAREEDGAFDFAEMVYEPFTRRERYFKQALRNNTQ